MQDVFTADPHIIRQFAKRFNSLFARLERSTEEETNEVGDGG